MPKYRFKWTAFDDETLTAVASACGFEGEDPAGWISINWKRPDEELVRRSKQALERTWLPDCPYLKDFVRQLIDSGLGPMKQPTTRDEYVEYVSKCRNSSRFRRLLLGHLLMFGEERPYAEVIDGRVIGHSVLRPSGQPADERKAFPYQQEAWNRLSACLARGGNKGGFPGLLVMPTGSGKTFTAVHWLMENVIARGGRVMWVAHRDSLLEQAWREFRRLSCLAAVPGRHDTLNMRIVSGGYGHASQLSPDNDVMLCSVASLARNREVVRDVLRDQKVFLVIDEAHHSPAKSYRDIIHYMKSLKNNQLLGLTATPTRMVEEERSTLSSLFGNNIIYQVGLGELVERGYLARPTTRTVYTHVAAEEGMTDEERRHLAKWDDLGEATLARLGELSARNDLILSHFIENRAKYGKTLIFANNVHHAFLLAEKFRANGIAADYVASYAPDNEPMDKDAVRQAFSDPDSGLDVLVNVQMLTEGVDLPAVQTVFLARPTNSEVLMQQMVGRALRSKKVGGTERAYLVSFEDHWAHFPQFERPFELLPELRGFEEETFVEDGEQPAGGGGMGEDEALADGVLRLIPYEVMRAVATALSRHRAIKAEVFEAVPCGWYVLEREVDGEDDVTQVIPVFNHDRPCWEALVGYLRGLLPEQAEKLDIEEVFNGFFGDCSSPRPRSGFVEQMVMHRAVDGDEPVWEGFAERERIDPMQVAQDILDADMGRRESQALIAQRYESALARAVYPSVGEYWAAVDEAVRDIQNPGEAHRLPPGVPVFEPLPTQMMAPGPAHDLGDIMVSMLRRGAELLGLPELPGNDIQLKWTDRIIKGYYAEAEWFDGSCPGTGQIKVNILADSPDVSRETMEFLMWHEYLHIWLQQKHTKEFRRHEKMWPTFVECDRELNTLNERFGVNYW